jgi:hypothetical protein
MADTPSHRAHRWVTVPDPIRNDRLIPSVPGCYVMNFGGHLYIGSTTNLHARFSQHGLMYSHGNRILSPWGACEPDRFRFKYRPSICFGDWLMHEARLIRRLKPSLNVRGSTGRKWRFERNETGVPLIEVHTPKGIHKVHVSVELYTRGKNVYYADDIHDFVAKRKIADGVQA